MAFILRHVAIQPVGTLGLSVRGMQPPPNLPEGRGMKRLMS